MKNYSADSREIKGILDSVKKGKLHGNGPEVYEMSIVHAEGSSIIPPMQISVGLVEKYFGSLDEDLIKTRTPIRLQEKVEGGLIHQFVITQTKNYISSGYPVPEEYREKSFEDICKPQAHP